MRLCERPGNVYALLFFSNLILSGNGTCLRLWLGQRVDKQTMSSALPGTAHAYGIVAMIKVRQLAAGKSRN